MHPKTLLGVLVGLRAGWALFVWLSGIAVHFEWETPLSRDSYFVNAVHDAAPLVLIAWTAYVAGYAVAAIIFWLNLRAAVAIYGASLLIDLALWAVSGVLTNYDLAMGGRAATIDMVFNLVDLVLFLGLVLVMLAEARRAQNAPYVRRKS